ncbi:MAG: hypothetical protein E7265_10710 [Lachnospiraceae bacterium]|nr:hypothetical protein [Lachnospiraceae bacterium]
MKKKLAFFRTGLIIALLIIGACVGIIYFSRQKIEKIEARVVAAEQELVSHKMLVYVASQDIPKGAKIQDGINVYKQEIYTGLERSSYITIDMLGQTALIDIATNEPIMANMVTAEDVTRDLRDYEISFANLMYNLSDYDFIDVRVRYADGTDYVLLSKKMVEELVMEECVFTTTLTEDEILRVSCAIIDAYTTSGTYIYTTRYTDANLQNPAVPNYPVSQKALQVIYNNPNIISIAEHTLNMEARMNLEARMKDINSNQLQAVVNGTGISDNAALSIFGEPAQAPDEYIPIYD